MFYNVINLTFAFARRYYKKKEKKNVTQITERKIKKKVVGNIIMLFPNET